MKRTKFFLFFLFFSLFLNTSAQWNFQSGTIYLKNGEAKTGLINVLNEIAIKNECQFKETKTAPVTKYSPSEITGFKLLEDKMYVSKNVTVNNTSKSFFLECLVDGIADLYFMKGDDKSYHYFIQNEGDSLRELLNTKSEFYRNSQLYVKQNKEYVTTLHDVFDDSPEMVGELKYLPFLHKKLINATKDYHDYVCDDYECVVYSKKTKAKVYLGVKVGTNNSVVLFDAKDNYFQSYESDPIKLVPAYYFGVSLTQTNLLGAENLNQTIAISYLRDHYQMKRTTIKQDNLWIPMYFTKTISFGNIKPFLDYGISHVVMLKSSIDSHLYNETVRRTIGIYQLNGLLGAGLEYSLNDQSFSIASRIELGTGINKMGKISNNYLKSTNVRLSLDLAYRFKIN